MEKKKKLGFVVAVPGSAESFLSSHFEELCKIYDVSLIANFPEGYDAWRFEGMNLRFVSAPIQRQISFVNDLKALFALYRIFKREKFDSVHSVTPKAGLLSAIAGWMAGIKVRIHIFTGQVWATRRGAMRTILKTMDRLIALFDNHILVDGEGQRRFLIKEGVLKEKNSKVLANGSIAGVKLEKFNISAQIRKAEREKLGFAPDDVCFIFLGRLNHDKGIGELYEAFNRLAGENDNAKLVLYGTDEEHYDPKADAFSHIQRGVNYFFPGRTSQPFNALQAGDVFVLPTWREGFGMSVIEAQALSLPVITSDAYGVVDASVEGETGLRCKVGDADSLYEAMNTYLHHPELIRKHGEAGRARVIEKFDQKVVTKAWIEFYAALER